MQQIQYSKNLPVRERYLLESCIIEISFNPAEDEIWKPVPGYESDYLVSSFGRVKSLKSWGDKPRILYPSFGENRGLRTFLRKDGKYKAYCIDRLVLAGFYGAVIEEIRKVIHRDKIIYNNNVKNLDWV